MEKKGKEYTEAQIKYTLERYESGRVKNFEAYLKKAVENDYAGAEIIDLGELKALTYKDLIGVRVRNGEIKYEITKLEEKDAGMPEEMRSDDYIVYLKPVNGGDTIIEVWSKDTIDKMLERLREEIKRRK